MEFSSIFPALRRNWWLVLITALAAVAIALAASYLSPPRYRTKARFIVAPVQAVLTEQSDLINSLNALDKRSLIATYAEVLNSTRMLAETAETLELDPEVLAQYRFATVALPEANILDFTVEGPSPYLAALLANGVGQRAIEFTRSLYAIYTISFLDQAVVPLAPFAPQPRRDAGLALILGAAVGGALAVFRETPGLGRRTPGRSPTAPEAHPETLVLTRSQFESHLSRFITEHDGRTVSLALLRVGGWPGSAEPHKSGQIPQTALHQLLNQVLLVLKNELRSADVIGLWARADFAVLLPDTSGPAAVAALDRLQLNLARPMRYSREGDALRLHVVFAVAELTAGVSPKTLLFQVRQALEQATREGKNFALYQLPDPLAAGEGSRPAAQG